MAQVSGEGASRPGAATQDGGDSEQGSGPWFAGRDLALLFYRINRRPLDQPKLFSREPSDFVEHLMECLVVGVDVTTSGAGVDRHWVIGNRRLDGGDVYGRLGFRSPELRQQDEFDADTGSWTDILVEDERVATTPFVILGSHRVLCVVKNPKIGEATIPKVFEKLLNLGEMSRPEASTIWAVEPLLDEADFEKWLAGTDVLTRVTFIAKLPNPDAASKFEELVASMEAVDATEMKYSVATSPEDETGLAKDQVDVEETLAGLREMTRRGYAKLRAAGRAASGARREYSQSQRVLRARRRMPASYPEAEAVLRAAAEQETRGRFD